MGKTYTSAWVNISSTYWTIAEFTYTLTNVTWTDIEDDCDGI